MPNEEYHLSDKVLSEEYIELAFKKVMSLYCENESEKILEEMKKRDAEKESEPADEQKIEKLISSCERKENVKYIFTLSKKIFAWTASLFFVVAISLSSVVVVSAEVREAVAEFLYDIVCETTDKYTEITIGEKSGFVDPELYDWPGAYAPTYMPEGYVFDEKVSSEVDHDILYRNGENIIIIGQFISTHFRVDSEGAELVEEIKIGNSKALLIINDGITSVNWSSGETMLTVSGNGDSDEIVKVAKSIEIFN